MNVFSTRISNSSVNIWLLIARLITGSFMLTHGIPKLQHVMVGNMEFGNPIGIGAAPSLLLAVFAEVICSALLMLGLATRLASAILIINMLVAAFIALGSEPFEKKELALLYLAFYVGFLILGGGRFAIDNLLSKKNRSRY